MQKKRIIISLGYVLLATFLSGLRPLWALPPGAGTPVVLIHKYEADGEKLSIVTIIQRETSADSVSVNPDLSQYPAYTEALLNYVNNWVPETYIRMGLVERGSAIHHSLLHEEKAMDNRSAIVFIAEENNLNNIRAFVRFSRRGHLEANERHPLEQRNPDVHLPVAPATQVMLDGSMAYASDSAEIKNFIQDPKSNKSYLSLLMWRAIQSGVMGYTFHKEFIDGQLRPVLPLYFAAETHKGTVRSFIDGAGFEMMDEISDPTKEFQYYIKSSLENAFQLDERFGGTRSGRRPSVEVNPKQLKPVYWKPRKGFVRLSQECEQALTSKLPFYEEIF